MKCFMIVNKFDEVVYVNYDSEFVRNLEQIIIDHDLNQVWFLRSSYGSFIVGG